MKTYNLVNISSAYVPLNNMERALQYFEKNLSIKRKLGNKRGVELILNNIALANKHMRNLEKTAVYYDESLKINKKIDYKRRIAGNLTTLESLRK
jgi:tetratricopeptide (TPR) repeat protein